MIEFRDALTDLLEEFGTNDGGYVIESKWAQSYDAINSIKIALIF